MLRVPILLFLLLTSPFSHPIVASAEVLTCAVASNFLSTAKRLAPLFQKETGHQVRMVSGSTGKLYAQILHGAPFDVFLAADQKRPRLLEDKGPAVSGSRFTYARGKLVLWSRDPEFLKQDGKAVLRQKSFRHLALANPKTAPYGKAAQSVLNHLQLWESVNTKLVRGENIGQTFQFIATGNSELGFVSLSQILDPKLKDKGSHWNIPETLYDPIRQDAVLLKHGADRPSARSWMQFLKSKTAQSLIQKYGYLISLDPN